MNKFCIYGAGIVAASIYTALKEKYHCMPAAFLVSNKEDNPETIDEIPVKALSEWNETSDSMIYLIAVPKSHHSAIMELFQDKGIDRKQIVLIDNNMENQIMGDFYKQSSLFVTAQQVFEQGKPSVEVFQAKCHVDRRVSDKYHLPQYVRPIQVGAALTEQVILDTRDNVGDNISAKNGNYCELTASYFAWKNSSADYKGLCHYRRVFDLQDAQIAELMADGSIDVILPYPSIHYPNIFVQHVRYVNDTDWNAMLQALEETAPQYYGEVQRIFQGQFFYNFNMLIAKREVFDDYCSFLFSVLKKTEELTSPKGWERSDRFAGYLGENLTTLYFMVNKDRLNIVHTGKLWLT